jgi:hypothetical protein
VLGLWKNIILFFVIEDKEFIVEFRNQPLLIRPKDYSTDTTQVIGVREGNSYKL